MVQTSELCGLGGRCRRGALAFRSGDAASARGGEAPGGGCFPAPSARPASAGTGTDGVAEAGRGPRTGGPAECGERRGPHWDGRRHRPTCLRGGGGKSLRPAPRMQRARAHATRLPRDQGCRAQRLGRDAPCSAGHEPDRVRLPAPPSAVEGTEGLTAPGPWEQRPADFPVYGGPVTRDAKAISAP